MKPTGQPSLADKRIIVSGGTAGLGLAMARALLEGGARILVTGRDAERGAAAERELGKFGDCRFVRHDATDEEAWRFLLALAMVRFDGLDGLVNNVGVNEVRPLARTTYADFLRLTRVNLHATWLGTMLAGTLIGRLGGGAIVNTGSMAALYAHPQVAPYCSAKAMVAGLTRAATREFAGQGVRVNVIHPGIFMTDLTERTAFTDEATRQAQIARIPAGRFGRPEELGPLVRFLMSDEAQGLSGTEFVVDGGRTAW